MFLGHRELDTALTFYAQFNDSTNTASNVDAGAPSYVIVEDEEGTVIASGSMTRDAAWPVGLYSERITLDSVGSLPGFEKGKDYCIRITGTIDTVTPGAIHQFTIGIGAVAEEVAAIPGDVWDVARALHVAAGSFGQGVASVQGNVTGNLGGNVLGNVAGDVQGNVDGNLGGNVVGNVAGDVQGNVDGSVGSVAAGGIAAASFVAGAINAAAIATDAIGSDELAATAVDEIVDATWDEPLTGATHNVPTSSGRRLRNIQDFGIYDMASVWVDEVAGTSAGIVDGEDATVTNRADDFDNAQTVAVSVGLDTIHVQAGNAITLTAGLTNFRVWGVNYGLALGGQAITGCRIENATVTGISTGPAEFTNCVIGAATFAPGRFLLCSLTGTLTVGSAGNYQFVQCQSGVAGAVTPVVDLGAAIGATTMEFRRWSGGLTLNNVQAGDVISIDVVSGGTITINGTGGTVVIRGMCDVVDGSGGAVAITQTTVLNQLVISDQVWEETLADHSGTIGSTAEALAAAGAGGDATLANQNTMLANQFNIEAATTDIQGRIPLLLVGGRMDSIPGAMSAAALAQFFNTDSGTTYLLSVAGSVVQEIADNATLVLGPAQLDAIADAVWIEVLAIHSAPGNAAEALLAAGAGATPAVIAAAVWNALKATHLGDTIMGDIATEVDNLEFTGREG